MGAAETTIGSEIDLSFSQNLFITVLGWKLECGILIF